jgi:predicted nucleic acid-binding Zn ribbon protein
MPDYAWKCRFCDFIQTVWKAFAAEWIIPICPNCDTEMIRDYRISGVHFKGNGFYQTDK